MTGAALAVTEYTDPACPWAWGTEPKLRWLRQRLGRAGAPVRWRRVFGILFDDGDDPAPDPAAEARWYNGFIAEVAAHTGAPHADRLAWLTRSSLPASLAGKAAETQGADVAERVVRRLRESTFIAGTPADDEPGIRHAVTGVPGLDVDRLVTDLAGATDAVRADHAETRRPCDKVLAVNGPGPHSGQAKELDEGIRYALPTLVLTGAGGSFVVPGWRPLREYVDAVHAASGIALPPEPPLTAEDALAHYETLTGPELSLLAGTDRAPGVEVPTANGPLWIAEDRLARWERAWSR
ncbi:DsbA family oxidoreductase [Actinokineospora cianjurensis]|uniref:Putative DsbA family dithiol-disulfide isomerase n=1 Tax=Actinokineospora cianjurensis TaxID=585224 RepID=A0A421B1I4_9PSEU|nr:DsbA family protein [Actinokineospora cianjurensis]RLK58279.1 putative DsbA family dithiol-disulfide isomerase [Actinokineospora cianjurensis]